MWAADGGEGAKFWLQVLTELKNRGVQDAWMVVCDGLKGLPDATGGHFPGEGPALKCVYLAVTSSARPGRAAGSGPCAGNQP
nr:transposase [Micromonospora chokoriensis]